MAVIILPQQPRRKKMARSGERREVAAEVLRFSGRLGWLQLDLLRSRAGPRAATKKTNKKNEPPDVEYEKNFRRKALLYRKKINAMRISDTRESAVLAGHQLDKRRKSNTGSSSNSRGNSSGNSSTCLEALRFILSAAASASSCIVPDSSTDTYPITSPSSNSTYVVGDETRGKSESQTKKERERESTAPSPSGPIKQIPFQNLNKLFPYRTFDFLSQISDVADRLMTYKESFGGVHRVNCSRSVPVVGKYGHNKRYLRFVKFWPSAWDDLRV